MADSINLTYDDNKVLNVRPLQKVLREGEANVEVIKLRGPGAYGSLTSFGALTWTINGTYSDHEYTAMSAVGVTVDEESGEASFLWTPDEQWTAYGGDTLEIALVGVSSTGEQVIKILGNELVRVIPTRRKVGTIITSALEALVNTALREIQTLTQTVANVDASAEAAASSATSASASANTASSKASAAATSATAAANSAKAAATSAATMEGQLANKVDKVSGKGLSTNDFTAAYKSKLDGIAAGANKYTLPTANNTTLGGVKLSSTTYGTSGNDDGVAATPAAVSAVRELTEGKRDAGAEGSVSANGSLTVNVSGLGRRLLAAGDALYVLSGWSGSAYLVTIMENSVVKVTQGGASAATITIKNSASYSVAYMII